jgi:uncharacterized membrane protein YkgB
MHLAIRPHDVIAGIGVAAWILGMGLVLGIEEPGLQLTGGVLWVVGFVVTALAAASAYLSRERASD